MIIFKPKHNLDNFDGSPASYLDHIDTIKTENLASQLTEKVKEEGVLCEAHPDAESVVLMTYTGEKPEYEIESCCCDNFKKELEEFLEL